MNERSGGDGSLEDGFARNVIDRPIIIVENVDGRTGTRQQFRLHLTELDPHMTEHALFGVLLSDLLDHIARAYRQATGRDERAIREAVLKVMRDEDRFKARDPSRGNMSGNTVFPRRN